MTSTTSQAFTGEPRGPGFGVTSPILRRRRETILDQLEEHGTRWRIPQVPVLEEPLDLIPGFFLDVGGHVILCLPEPTRDRAAASLCQGFDDRQAHGGIGFLIVQLEDSGGDLVGCRLAHRIASVILREQGGQVGDGHDPVVRKILRELHRRGPRGEPIRRQGIENTLVALVFLEGTPESLDLPCPEILPLVLRLQANEFGRIEWQLRFVRSDEEVAHHEGRSAQEQEQPGDETFLDHGVRTRCGDWLVMVTPRSARLNAPHHEAPISGRAGCFPGQVGVAMLPPSPNLLTRQLGSSVIPREHPILILAVILIAGVTSGALVARFGIPGVTGQILVGILLGSSCLDFLPEDTAKDLVPVTHFALSLIAVRVGSHLNVAKLRNAGKRLFALALCEATITPLVVILCLAFIPGTNGVLVLLLAALAISTAPATVLAVVKESRSRGVFVKTLVAAVALNNIACVASFGLAHSIAQVSLSSDAPSSWWMVVATPLRDVIYSLLLGVFVGALLILGTRNLIRPDRIASASLIAILFTTGLADLIGTSSLLACMFLGVTLANLTPDREELSATVMGNLENAILAAFFTLAGLKLHLDVLATAGLLALASVGARLLGKAVAAHVAMTIAGAPEKVRRNLGLALTPQAGVAVALIFLIEGDPLFVPYHDVFLAVGLATVTLNELIGPLLLRSSLKRSGDLGKDRDRLIDFIHEEHITTGLQASTKEEAITELVDLLMKTHRVQVTRDELLESVLQRERDVSTCIGGGLAIPHGTLHEGEHMMGVMGISPRGLPFPTPDGRPVHCMVLLATPPTQRDRHLRVLAALARSIGTDPSVQAQLFHARSPAHAYEILHQDEAEDFNYFLDDERP